MNGSTGSRLTRFVTRSFLNARRRLHCERSNSCRRLRIEALEDRRLLSITGEFVRVYGGISDGGWREAFANGEYDFDEGDGIGHDYVISQYRTTFVDEGSAAAETNRYIQGSISAPTGGMTKIPKILASGIRFGGSKGLSTGDNAYTYNANQYSGNAGFEYHADPGVTQDLEFHGHLAISAGIERIVTGYYGEADTNGFYIKAEIPGDGFLEAALQQGGLTWDWFQDLPGEDQDFQGISGGAVSRHVTYTVTITDGWVKDFWTTFSSEPHTLISAAPQAYAREYHGAAVAAWGYVTIAGQDVPDGDADYDGVVDGDDFQLWQEGSLQADFDMDGDVDDDDLEVWAQNTTELVVSTEVDEIDADRNYGDLSLREAIAMAADENHPGHDDIYFAPSVAQINVTYDGPDSMSFPDVLSIGSSVTLHGLGADRLTLNATGVAMGLSVSGPSGTAVTIRGMTITGSYDLGIVTSAADVVLDSVEVRNNGSTGVRMGAGGGSLTVINSTVAGNQGIGIHSMTSPNVTIVNSTISGNIAPSVTGGVLLVGGTIINSTITDNIVRSTGAGTAGGLFARGVSGGSAPVYVKNSIIAGNFEGSIGNEVPDDVGRTTTGLYPGSYSPLSSNNLIGTLGNSGLSSTTNIVIGGTGDPGLDALADYGGSTRTHALLAGSPAIDQGDNSVTSGLVHDQRGWDYEFVYGVDDVAKIRVDYSRIINGGIGLTIDTVDIGAYEYRPGSTSVGGGSGAVALFAQSETGSDGKSALTVPIESASELTTDPRKRIYVRDLHLVDIDNIASQSLLLALNLHRNLPFESSGTENELLHDQIFEAAADEYFAELELDLAAI